MTNAAAISTSFWELPEMPLPSRQEAEAFLEYVITSRNNSPCPFLPQWEKEFRAHSRTVAEIASTIAAKTAYLNTERAYLSGFLHDCGRIKDEKSENVFHGWTGYELMKSQGWNEIARISLTHCFLNKDFNPDLYPQAHQDLLRCKQIISQLDYDDYDKLLQLADMLNDRGKSCTLSYRCQSLAQRYPFQEDFLQAHMNAAEKLKQYFDEKCGCDTYTLLGIQ